MDERCRLSSETYATFWCTSLQLSHLASCVFSILLLVPCLVIWLMYIWPDWCGQQLCLVQLAGWTSCLCYFNKCSFGCLLSTVCSKEWCSETSISYTVGLTLVSSFCLCLGFAQIVRGLPKVRAGKIMRRILRSIAANKFTELGDTSTLAEPAVVEDIIQQHQTKYPK